MATLEKQSGETRRLSLDFSGSMSPTATIESVTSIVAANQGEVSGSANLTVSGEAIEGQAVSWLFAGGTDGELYKIEARVADSDGQILELEGYLRVRDA